MDSFHFSFVRTKEKRNKKKIRRLRSEAKISRPSPKEKELAICYSLRSSKISFDF